MTQKLETFNLRKILSDIDFLLGRIGLFQNIWILYMALLDRGFMWGRTGLFKSSLD